MPNSDHLEELKKRLYRRGDFQGERRRSGFSPERVTAVTAWPKDEASEEKEFLSLNLAKKIFLFSLAFFVLVAGISFFIFTGGGNVVSSENIDISIRAPVSVKGGEVLPLELVIANKNPVAIEFSDLAITFPVGTRSADDLTKNQERFRLHLGTIESGEERNQLVRIVLFGQENTEQDIKIALEYRTAGSNAIYVKEKEYKLLLTSSPLSLSVSLPEEVNAGQEIIIDLELTSGSEGILEGLILEANYPNGFSFSGGSPAPAFGGNIWRLGDLAPGAVRRLKIRGTLEGQENETKAFRFSAGAASADNPRLIAVPYSSSLETLTIRRPFVGLEFILDGSSEDELAVPAGKTLRADLTWTNNLADQVIDGEVKVKINGSAFNEPTVFLINGFYQSSDKTIVWNKQNFSGLEAIEPGGGGHVNFSFASLSSSALRSQRIQNPAIELEVFFRGSRLKPQGGIETIESRLVKKVKLNSELQLSARAVRTVGPFANTGPMPPRANQESSYTILWSLANSSNDVSQAMVRARLPSYVKWLGNVSPASEGVSFDLSRGEIAWQIGELGRGIGSVLPAREVAFQISFVASLSQVGASPTLILDAGLSGVDGFTGANLNFVARELTTRIATDPLYVDEWSRVAP